jgi:hypothetical protein
VTWTGGDPDLVLLVVVTTLRAIAQGLEDDDQRSEGDS